MKAIVFSVYFCLSIYSLIATHPDAVSGKSDTYKPNFVGEEYNPEPKIIPIKPSDYCHAPLTEEEQRAQDDLIGNNRDRQMTYFERQMLGLD